MSEQVNILPMIKVQDDVWLQRMPQSITAGASAGPNNLKYTVQLTTAAGTSIGWELPDVAMARRFMDGLAEACNAKFATATGQATPSDSDGVLTAQIRLICQEYETNGFADPGRAMDAIRDILTLRG